MTKNIFKCAVAKQGGNATEIARRICECAAEWNEYVKREDPEWITVKDTTLGPVWLESFNEEKVSFGFLEFLTEAILINRHCIPGNIVKMADLEQVTGELRALLPKMQGDEQCLTVELVKGIYSVENNCNVELSRRDVAQFVLCGGFGKDLTPSGKTAFLKSIALKNGYWVTMVVCRNGKMQIRFFDAGGEKRIAQRKTRLKNYSGIGVVEPKDYEKVREISVGYDTSDDRHLVMIYWNEMEDTTTREEMRCLLRNSRRFYYEANDFHPTPLRLSCLADMTIGEAEEDRLLGDANNFAHDIDPFMILELAQSGSAAVLLKSMEEREAANNSRHAELLSDVRQNLDTFRDAERREASNLWA